MSHFVNQMMFAFLALFPILNPPAMAPVFLQLTPSLVEEDRNRLSARIGLYTFVFLTTLLLVGGWILKILGISIPVIAIAGGLLLFHSAWGMLKREPKISASEQQEIRSYHLEQAFFPLTMPVTAGPGSIAVTLSLVPRGKLLAPATLLDFVAVTAGIAMAAFTVFIFYRYATKILTRLGETAAATISQLSAFVLLAIGVEIVWSGIRDLVRTL